MEQNDYHKKEAIMIYETHIQTQKKKKDSSHRIYDAGPST